MNAFDEAARKAAELVFDWYDDDEDEHRVTLDFATPILQKKILDNFADLRATYEKLVELASLSRKQDILCGDLEMMRKYNQLLTEPLVVEAMKGDGK